jgi:copper chaperone CopZ
VVKFWADREVSVQQHATPINRVPGVTGVQVDDQTKTATVSYTGEYPGVLGIGAAVGTHGIVIDPVYVAAGITAAPEGYCTHDLTEALKAVPGVRKAIPARGGFELWVNSRDLSVEKLYTQPFRFQLLSHDIVDVATPSQAEPEQWEKLRDLLTETKSVVRASATPTGLQVLSARNKLSADAIRKLAERAELQVKITTKK